VANHYTVLNVPPNADRAEIRASFRALARRNHPDVGGDAEQMQAIIEAWAVLGRSDRRAAYDLELAMQKGRTRRPQAATSSRQSAGTATAEREAAVAGRTPREANRVDFGRYTGWTIDALVHHDPEYLEWLARSQAGRVWRGAINAALAERAERMAPPPPPIRRRRRFGR
jgi:curved DNA-binding protein CbpA